MKVDMQCSQIMVGLTNFLLELCNTHVQTLLLYISLNLRYIYKDYVRTLFIYIYIAYIYIYIYTPLLFNLGVETVNFPRLNCTLGTMYLLHICIYI
uniref:Uncharacterized protein n=1 Tax=Cannabis sativa TaxID=3483 RepID=A0A803R7J4_CANSA